MDFSKRPADPKRHLVGIAFVVAVHLLLFYGLMSGMARKVIEVVRAPIETKIIEEISKPPAPPEVVAPPPPKLEAPPPPYIPPPEVVVSLPPPPAPPITAAPSPTPPVAAPMAPVAPPAAAAPAPAAPQSAPSVGVSCPGHQQVMIDAGFPREATRAQIDSGEVVVSFTIGTKGEVKNPAIVRSTNRAFNRHSLETVLQFKCVAQPQDMVGVLVELSYKSQ